MKFLVLSFAFIWQFSGGAFPAMCQKPIPQTGRLHFSFPFPGAFHGRYELASSNAQWVAADGKAVCAGCRNGSILQLRGDVEVRTVVCGPTGDKCTNSPVLWRADAIDYNEATGNLETRGVVRTVLSLPPPDVKIKASR